MKRDNEVHELYKNFSEDCGYMQDNSKEHTLFQPTSFSDEELDVYADNNILDDIQT